MRYGLSLVLNGMGPRFEDASATVLTVFSLDMRFVTFRNLNIHFAINSVSQGFP